MKIKGHTTIILKDVKTGKVECHEDDNYMTNAVVNYFANCGFMNYPNLSRDNMVELLLGGVMAFDEPISENTDDPTIVHVPAGHKMIANGSVGTLNNGEVLELGSYSSTESGWQQDGSYVQTYDYTTTQANGTISCVCLTGKNYAYAGEGNSISHIRHSTKVDITSLKGSATDYSGSVIGYPFNVDLLNSVCYTFAIETRTDSQTEEEYITGVLRKYRISATKLNLKSEISLISEREIEIDNDLKVGVTQSSKHNMYEAHDGKLYIYNAHTYIGDYLPLVEWGNTWTQYLWTLTPSGTLTKQTLINTSGETLYGLQAAHFDGNYIFFIVGIGTDDNGTEGYIDSTSIYVLNRSNGVIHKIENPYGTRQRLTGKNSKYYNSFASVGWNLLHGSRNGRIVTSGNYPIAVDAVSGTAYPNNASNSTIGNLCETTSPLIRTTGIHLFRDQSYIASINNLESPVVKTAEKTMKIIYRLTFEEEES